MGIRQPGLTSEARVIDSDGSSRSADSPVPPSVPHVIIVPGHGAINLYYYDIIIIVVLFRMKSIDTVRESRCRRHLGQWGRN